MPIAYESGFAETATVISAYERAGLDMVSLPEAYSFDSVSQLGYLAARTQTVELTTSILNIYSRTPALLAMTAAGLDYVSGGRFRLGIGASGPQVIEGLHGVRYDAPVARAREVVEICRQAWRREPVVHDGPHYHLPLGPEHGGGGLAKPLKLINQPVRSRIPMTLAALGPSNVRLAAELFEGWEPSFYYPEGAAAAFGDALTTGLARRDKSLGPLEIHAITHLAITSDPAEIAAANSHVRRHLALYIGGMGARTANFYNTVARRFGFEQAAEQVQDLYLGGQKDAATAALPEELVRGVSLVGPDGHVKERLAAMAEAGVTTVVARPLAPTHERRVADIAALKQLAPA
jgi:F420-dependent oxidoreductase-like protein